VGASHAAACPDRLAPTRARPQPPPGEGADPALIALLAAAGKSASTLPSDMANALVSRKVCARVCVCVCDVCVDVCVTCVCARVFVCVCVCVCV
jgi:hypothetical protein